MNRSSQGGFTLIELVVVIVILGILAAFAVPRFMGMEGEARAATVKNMAGNLRAAYTMARGKCMAQGCGAGGTITFENQSVTMVNGYPSAATIANTLQTVQGFTPTVAATTYTLRKDGGGVNCWVRYTQAVNVNTPPVISFQSGVPGAGNPVVTEQAVAAALATAC
jgi:MSHA pilin protein MshA